MQAYKISLEKIETLQKSSTKPVRSTYNKKNGEFVRQLLLDIAKDNSPRMLSFADYQYTPATLYMKICDGWKYLADTEGEPYKTLRETWRVKTFSDKFVFMPRTTVISAYKAEEIIVDEIIKWLDSDKHEIKEFVSESQISDEVKQKISGILAGRTDIDYLFKDDKTLIISRQ